MMIKMTNNNSSFSTFIDKYGTDTSTNFQLINWARQLNIKPFYCLMRDEISEELKNKNEYFAIVNIHKSNQNGVHWSALCKKDNHFYFFDSYGLDPINEIINLKDVSDIPMLCSTFIFQTENDSYCGQISLYVLYLLSKNYQFEDIILCLKKETLNK